ncbi:MAG: hypothetical protein MK135_02305 [Polyangiaceae bacterium]|nr:hypothetical protein [Polyangiaceae bacterium]
MGKQDQSKDFFSEVSEGASRPEQLTSERAEEHQSQFDTEHAERSSASEEASRLPSTDFSQLFPETPAEKQKEIERARTAQASYKKTTTPTTLDQGESGTTPAPMVRTRTAPAPKKKGLKLWALFFVAALSASALIYRGLDSPSTVSKTVSPDAEGNYLSPNQRLMLAPGPGWKSESITFPYEATIIHNSSENYWVAAFAYPLSELIEKNSDGAARASFAKILIKKIEIKLDPGQDTLTRRHIDLLVGSGRARLNQQRVAICLYTVAADEELQVILAWTTHANYSDHEEEFRREVNGLIQPFVDHTLVSDLENN